MNQRTILLVCGVLAAASMLATCVHAFNDMYLDLDSVTEDEAAAAGRALDLLKPFLADDPDSVRSALVNFFQSDPEFEPSAFAFLDELNRIEWADVADERVMKSIAQTRIILRETQDNSLDMVRDYLFEHAGRLFGEHIVEPLIDQIGHTSATAKEAESIFDQLFGAIFGVRKSQQEDYLRELQGLDLATTSKPFTPALNAARHRGIRDLTCPLDAFVSLMGLACPDLCYPHGAKIELIAFAKGLDLLSEQVPWKIKKFIEYSRLCSILLSGKWNAVRENLNRHLPPPREPVRRGPTRGRT